MKKEVKTMQRFCDHCEEHSEYVCEGCGKDICRDCIEDNAHIFLVKPDMSEGAEYLVCNDCLTNPPDNIKVEVEFLLSIKEMGTKEIARRDRFNNKIEKYRKNNLPESLNRV
jgi:hypothetical protein